MYKKGERFHHTKSIIKAHEFCRPKEKLLAQLGTLSSVYNKTFSLGIKAVEVHPDYVKKDKNGYGHLNDLALLQVIDIFACFVYMCLFLLNFRWNIRFVSASTFNRSI